MMEQTEVNGLKLPPLLLELLKEGQWRHPGDSALQQWVPFLREPVDFLETVDFMQRESSGLLANEPRMATVYHLTRGSRSTEPIQLPWLDVDLAVFVEVNRFPGDDLAIALDYRTDAADPRVVANDWHHAPPGCIWREVTPTFSEFVRVFGAKL